MLDPETRHLLTDALRPPTGFSVEQALATTYTLDLESVLLAPLAMAAFDRVDTSNPHPAEPHALLEAIRRHADHTTILCQAAGIHVPSNYSRLAAFAEGMVAEVVPPPGRTFHPKIWLLRFVDAEGNSDTGSAASRATSRVTSPGTPCSSVMRTPPMRLTCSTPVPSQTLSESCCRRLREAPPAPSGSEPCSTSSGIP